MKRVRYSVGMSDEIVHLGASDFDACVAFLNRVFSEDGSLDFAAMLPTIYQPTEEHMGCHLAVRRGGDLAAVVGVFPMTLRMGEAALRLAGIGSVSVDPAHRGEGLMRLLMDRAMAEIRAGGFHLAWLAGQRQRYAYWGFERAGVRQRFTIEKRSLKHLDGATLGAGALEAWRAGGRWSAVDEDDDAWSAIADWRQRRPIRCDRGRDAIDATRWLRAHHHTPRVWLDGEDRPRALVVANESGQGVTEWGASDVDRELAGIAAWVEGGTDEHSAWFDADPLPGRTNRVFSAWADGTSRSDAGNWCVLDWPAVLSASLSARHAADPLPNGEASVQITGFTQAAVGLRIDGDHAQVAEVDGPTALAVDHHAAHRLLFGPVAPAFTADVPAAASALHAWCPLPLWLPRLDYV